MIPLLHSRLLKYRIDVWLLVIEMERYECGNEARHGKYVKDLFCWWRIEKHVTNKYTHNDLLAHLSNLEPAPIHHVRLD